MEPRDKFRGRERMMLLAITILSIVCLTLFITTIVFSQQQTNTQPQTSVPGYGPASAHDFEVHARLTMSQDAWNFVQDGATARRTQQDNILAFGKYKLKPKVLVNVSKTDTLVTAQKGYWGMPVGMSGYPYMRWMHADGDRAAVRASNNMRCVLILNDQASSSLEQMTKESPGHLWQEIHLYKNRDTTKEFVDRIIEAKKITAIVVSVNRPTLGISYKQEHGEIHFPDDISPSANFPGMTLKDLVNPGQTWQELAWLRNYTSLPLVVKGILRGDDAKMAVNHGADGILVSNDGGRLLDGVPAALDALPEVVAALNNTKVEVYMEGGVRTGTDVVKALLLGAKLVFVGRPVMWALHHSGYDGLEKLLEIYKEELTNTMQLLGAPTLEQLTPDMIVTS